MARTRSSSRSTEGAGGRASPHPPHTLVNAAGCSANSRRSPGRAFENDRVLDRGSEAVTNSESHLTLGVRGVQGEDAHEIAARQIAGRIGELEGVGHVRRFNAG